MKKVLIILFAFAISFSSFAQKKDYVFTIETDKGKLHLVLYDETPLHKANFIKLVKSKFYDGLLFHRVIEGFMIQGGDPNSKKAKPGERLGGGGDDMERIPFEYNEKLYHKKGVIAAARDGNPEKKSSASQFYLVQGKKLSDEELNAIEKRNSITYTPEQRDIYKTLGGVPRLDKNYTVFGEVIGETKVIDEIAKVKKDASDRPLEDQKMKISVKKVKKKKITKLYSYKY